LPIELFNGTLWRYSCDSNGKMSMNDKQAARCNETAVALVELLFRIGRVTIPVHKERLKKTTINFAMSCRTRTGLLPDI